MEKINRIQEIMMKQLERLDNETIMTGDRGKEELKRSSAISNTATTFIKTADLELKVLTTANKFNVDKDELSSYLGLK